MYSHSVQIKNQNTKRVITQAILSFSDNDKGVTIPHFAAT